MAEESVPDPAKRDIILFSDRHAVMDAIKAPEKATDRYSGDGWVEDLSHWQTRAALITLSNLGLLSAGYPQ